MCAALCFPLLLQASFPVKCNPTNCLFAPAFPLIISNIIIPPTLAALHPSGTPWPESTAVCEILTRRLFGSSWKQCAQMADAVRMGNTCSRGDQPNTSVGFIVATSRNQVPGKNMLTGSILELFLSFHRPLTPYSGRLDSLLSHARHNVVILQVFYFSSPSRLVNWIKVQYPG